MEHRSTTNSGRDAKIFSYTSRPHIMNTRPKVTRGGIRL